MSLSTCDFRTTTAPISRISSEVLGKKDVRHRIGEKKVLGEEGGAGTSCDFEVKFSATPIE
jgi:hypothetical protein